MRVALGLGVALLWAAETQAAVPPPDGALVCPARSLEPPTFDAPECEKVALWRADPQGRQVWLRVRLFVEPAVLNDLPLGVFVSAKASSEVFLNGQRLGSNGLPGARGALETPGRIDAVFHAPLDALRAGANEVVLRMSSHHGFLRLGFPVHYVGIGPYASPTAFLMGRYWPSLIPLGVLLAGVLSFAAGALRAVPNRKPALLLSLLSLFAAGQLLAEVVRGLVAYPYPLHDVRLLLIAALSLGFGLSLTALVASTFGVPRPRWLLGLVAAATLLSMTRAEGFDLKTGVGLMIPTLASLGVCVWAARRREPQARGYLAALGAFSASNLAFPSLFLDTIFFYEVAALVLGLLIFQAVAREQARGELLKERARSRQLEAALERTEDTPKAPPIRVASAGSTELVEADEILFCKGAGDYVELNLKDGRKLLHHASLTRLEDELPAAFLRVHRSYLVNTSHARSLSREASGVGALTLSDGTEVPVSRRVMPKVRNAFR